MMKKQSKPNIPLIERPEQKRIKVAILGKNDSATTLMRLFCESDDVEAFVLTDDNTSVPATDASAVNMVCAWQNCEELGTLDADIVIETTNNEKVRACLSKCKPGAEVIGRQGALLILELLQADKIYREKAGLREELEKTYEKLKLSEREAKNIRVGMEQTNRELDKHFAETFFEHEFFKALTSFSLSVEDVAGLIADGANGMLGVELSCVYVLDGKQLRLIGSQGRAKEEFRETFVLGEGLVGRCAQHRNLINKQDPTDTGFMADGRALKNQIAVPLMTLDKLFGVLAVGGTVNRLFTKSELSRATSIGHMASLALQNAIFSSELEQLAVTDRLTELYNHGYFQQRLEKEISLAKRKSLLLSLIMLDIDFFKQFNDTFGHPKGDRVLKRVSRILSELSRKEDTVARYGGEEFIIIVPGTGKRGAAAFAERIRAAIADEVFEGNDEQPHVKKTVSIGVASFPEDSGVQAELIEKADRALYEAKHSGRNRVVTAGEKN